MVDRYFTGTASRIEGVGLDVLAREARVKHEHAYPRAERIGNGARPRAVNIFRTSGKYHLLNPVTV